GDFIPDAQVNGSLGFSLIALICNRNSATFRALSSFKIMAQMYKVFIDHRPVLFISKEELSTKYRSINWDESKMTFKKIKKELKGIDIDNPLQIVCEDVKSAYKTCFSDFKKITAAGGIVESDKGFLLIKRKGMWDLPKGKKDKGEPI